MWIIALAWLGKTRVLFRIAFCNKRSLKRAHAFFVGDQRRHFCAWMCLTRTRIFCVRFSRLCFVHSGLIYFTVECGRLLSLRPQRKQAHAFFCEYLFLQNIFHLFRGLSETHADYACAEIYDRWSGSIDVSIAAWNFCVCTYTIAKLKLCVRIRLYVAFLPEASCGTQSELWIYELCVRRSLIFNCVTQTKQIVCAPRA